MRPSPGHYLQGVYANRNPSKVVDLLERALQGGWAVYVTQVMMDVGYGRTIRPHARPLEVLPALDDHADHRRRIHTAG